jgi:hypothetical protein
MRPRIDADGMSAARVARTSEQVWHIGRRDVRGSSRQHQANAFGMTEARLRVRDRIRSRKRSLPMAPLLARAAGASRTTP